MGRAGAAFASEDSALAVATKSHFPTDGTWSASTVAALLHVRAKAVLRERGSADDGAETVVAVDEAVLELFEV